MTYFQIKKIFNKFNNFSDIFYGKIKSIVEKSKLLSHMQILGLLLAFSIILRIFVFFLQRIFNILGVFDFDGVITGFCNACMLLIIPFVLYSLYRGTQATIWGFLSFEERKKEIKKMGVVKVRKILRKKLK